MDFTQEIAALPSFIHQGIYHAARGLTPLSRSLAGMDDPALRASCEQYHAFVTDLLSDMYDHPEAYFLPVMMLENFCGGKKVNGMKQRFPAKTKSILAQSRNAVHGYLTLLCLLGRHGVLQGDTLCVHPENMPSIAKQVSTTTSPISLEKRLAALARVGFVMSDIGFVSANHPGMFPALCALAQRDDKLSGFNFFAFTCAEFRNIGKKYKPTYEDYFQPLCADQRAKALALHDFALHHKLNPTISTFWKVDYKYRGVQVMCVSSAGDCETKLDIRLVGTYNWDDPALINDRLALTPPAFQRHALRHVWHCDACSTSHLGRFVTVLGKRQRVCGGGVIGFRWGNPTDEDIASIERMIQLRREIIDEI